MEHPQPQLLWQGTCSRREAYDQSPVPTRIVRVWHPSQNESKGVQKHWKPVIIVEKAMKRDALGNLIWDVQESPRVPDEFFDEHYPVPEIK